MTRGTNLILWHGNDSKKYLCLMYVWPCIMYENDERYQLDATIM